MQIEIMDRIAFSVVSKTCVKELVKEHPEWDGRIIKHNAKSRFKKMLQETPSIGSHRQNCMNYEGMDCTKCRSYLWIMTITM